MAHVTPAPGIVAGPGPFRRPCAARWRAALAGLLLIWAGTCLATPARAAETGESLEARVKAAFLYKFAGYVEWPEAAFTQPDTPVTIAVIGADPVAAELEQLVAGRRVNDRVVSVRRLRPGDAMSGTHILFIGNDAAASLALLLQSAQPFSILTVTESSGALERGSVINFVIADRRIRFEISRDSAEKNRLRLSSRLLAVARHVVGRP